MESRLRRLWSRLSRAAATDARHGRSRVAELAYRGSESRLQLAQALKSAAAAALAWWLAAEVLNLKLPYVAPLAALIMVRETVYGSILSGLRQVTAVAAGLTLAFLALALTDSSTLSMALVLPFAVLIGRYHRLDDQGIYTSFAALFLLTLGDADQDYLRWRLVETAMGAAIGAAINLVVLPPVQLGRATTLRRRITADTGELLGDLADGLREGFDRHRAWDWVVRAARLQEQVEGLRTSLREGRESLWMNPRWPHRWHWDAIEDGFRSAERLALATTSVQTVTDIFRDASRDDMPEHRLDGGFSGGYTRVLDRLAELVPDGVEAKADREQVERATAALRELETGLDGGVSGSPDAELRGSLLLAARRMLHDLGA